MAEWREQILEGLTSLDVLGYPGSVIVVGDHATPIIVGDGGSVVMAAATLGEGRLVTFTQDSYLKKFTGKPTGCEDFVNNVLSWLSNGNLSAENTGTMVDLNSVAEFPDEADVIVWTGDFTQKVEMCDQLRAFVKKGGALITGTTPWGMMQMYPMKNFSEMAIYPLLAEVGIYYTGDVLKFSPDGFQFPKNTASDDHHFIHCMKNLDVNGHTEISRQQCLTITEALFQLSKKVVRSLGVLDTIGREIGQEVEECAAQCHGYEELCEKVGSTKMEVFAALMPYRPKTKAPGIGRFPGDFEDEPDTKTATVNLTSTAHSEYLHTGLYLPAGRKCHLMIKSKLSRDEPWSILVGSHLDNLMQIAEKRRWSRVSYETSITEEKVEVTSFCGGLVYFKSPGVTGAELHVSIGNVVDAPYFNLTHEDPVAKWEKAKSHPGLWADIVGKNISFTVPGFSVKDIEDPSSAITFWDSVVASHHELRGTNVDHAKSEWVVTDKQPLNGYMHAGYPIVTHLDIAEPENKKFILRSDLNTCGGWGMFHEIGHNMQREAWTFDGTVEVTCNIFSLHASDVHLGVTPWIHPWLNGYFHKAVEFLTDGSDFAQWQTRPEIALFIYAQLQAAFGWEAYKKVLSSYEESPSDHLKTTQDKIDHWILTFSKVAGYNLLPLFKFWSFPVSSEVEDELSVLTPYFPDDDLVSEVPNKVNEILSKYPDCHRIRYEKVLFPNPEILVL